MKEKLDKKICPKWERNPENVCQSQKELMGE